MPILKRSFALVALLLLPSPRVDAAREAPYEPRLRIETDVSFTTNLVHWVDNLAGTSIGKTMPLYRRYWDERFGPPGEEDRRALAAFARIRNLPIPPAGRAVGNESGCLPVETEGLGWRQIFLAEAMGARSMEQLRRALSPYLAQQDLDDLTASLERFRPRFERVWKDLGHVRRFEGRFDRFLAEGKLTEYLDTLAGFFGVDARTLPPMKISFLGLPVNGPTHAEADGDRLLIEIRPLDAPRDQIQVVAHEASHFLMRSMPISAVDQLASQAYGGGESGALIWRYIWEGLPTALGQGLAEARLSPRTFSPSLRWYHVDSIDRFAKMIFPAVEAAVGGGRRVGDGLMGEIAVLMARSDLMREARPSDLLMTAFYASGAGMSSPMQMLRRRLGLGWRAASPAFDLGDSAGRELLRRYTCLGGVALISAAEIEKASSLDGTPLLPRPMLDRILERAAEGQGVIATGRRMGGGAVYFLVAPGPDGVGRLLEAFSRLRGFPDQPILVTAEPDD
jgi:hypothetical protein